ncbi:hypothetical protein NDU88_006480 [Pleurodeles waltl]|uniref:Uncharacterized protein n=1 Tax=Pleurodeles waltl TaxID=8319 RepID=A0AAV7WGH5_PLEWA|nr:hypothetical protein NDU88_006480 [Pleurodeles waltl]
MVIYCPSFDVRVDAKDEKVITRPEWHARAGSTPFIEWRVQRIGDMKLGERECIIYTQGTDDLITSEVAEDGNAMCGLAKAISDKETSTGSVMAGRERVMQVLCTGLQEQVTSSAYSELRETRLCQLKPMEEYGFCMQESGD